MSNSAQSALTLTSASEMVFRLLLALVAGILVGFERYQRGHPAGMRTFALVSLTSALLTASLAQGPYAELMGGAEHGGSRIVQGILAGIGFIGAGVIVRDAAAVRGLTSAASLWAVAAIGILIGTGETLLGFVAASLVLLVLIAFRWLDHFVSRRSYVLIHARFVKKAVPHEQEVRDRLEKFGFRVLALAFKGAKSGALTLRMNVWAPGKQAAHSRAALAQDFQTDSSIVDFSIEPASAE